MVQVISLLFIILFDSEFLFCYKIYRVSAGMPGWMISHLVLCAELF